MELRVVPFVRGLIAEAGSYIKKKYPKMNKANTLWKPSLAAPLLNHLYAGITLFLLYIKFFLHETAVIFFISGTIIYLLIQLTLILKIEKEKAFIIMVFAPILRLIIKRSSLLKV